MMSNPVSVLEARTLVRQFAQNANDPTVYTDTNIDNAILMVGRDFVDFTRCQLSAATVALLAANTLADFSGIADFLPNRIARLYIGTNPDIAVVDHQTVLDQLNFSSQQAVPAIIGFLTWNSAQVFPTPDVNYTMNLLWNVPFAEWTPGLASAQAATTYLSIPRNWMARILATGVPAKLQKHENEHPYTAEAWQEYLTFRSEIRGQAGMGAKVLYRRQQTPSPGIGFGLDFLDGSGIGFVQGGGFITGLP